VKSETSYNNRKHKRNENLSDLLLYLWSTKVIHVISWFGKYSTLLTISFWREKPLNGTERAF